LRFRRPEDAWGVTEKRAAPQGVTTLKQWGKGVKSRERRKHHPTQTGKSKATSVKNARPTTNAGGEGGAGGKKKKKKKNKKKKHGLAWRPPQASGFAIDRN